MSQPLTLKQGANFRVDITHNDAVGAAVPSGDVTAAELQVREAIGDATPLMTASISNGYLTVTNGAISINVPYSVTEGITLSRVYESRIAKFWYDLEVTYTDGVRERILEGPLYFSQEVTR